jgi:hypothetical protein
MSLETPKEFVFTDNEDGSELQLGGWRRRRYVVNTTHHLSRADLGSFRGSGGYSRRNEGMQRDGQQRRHFHRIVDVCPGGARLAREREYG